jgi:DNA-binding transcriptional LysR family regulator
VNPSGQVFSDPAARVSEGHRLTGGSRELAITELPEFASTEYFREKKLEPLLTDWCLPEGGLYFVTPTARARPAKVSALADFLIAKLTDAPWRAEVVMGWKPPVRRKK